MIEIKDLNKSFDGVSVLKDVSLEIEEGETLAIIGKSGSGKSVLMKHIVGLLKPDSGRVLVDGVDINRLPYNQLRKARQKFGVLFQGGALFDSMTALENVAFPLRAFSSLSDEEIVAQARECLEMVNLSRAETKQPSELSGGMQKRVALARAVALRPRYILYDEPTSGLDPHTSRTIDQLIIDLGDKLNITSVVISHDMHSVLRIADRAAFVHEGRLHWTGAVDDLHESSDSLLLDFVKANEYTIGRSHQHEFTH